MSKIGFREVNFGSSPKNQIQTPPDSPEKTTHPKDFPFRPKKPDGLSVGTSHAGKDSRGEKRNTSLGHINHGLTIPTSPRLYNTIEVPALRSPDADTTQFMRNSFGAALPIPKPKRQSRLSSVTYPADGQEGAKGTKAGVAQPPRNILASQVQDMLSHKVEKAKNMTFVFDIDGVLVHGDRPIAEGQRVLAMLNGGNQLGIRIPHIFLTNGSGKTELARTEQLSKILKNPLSTEQLIQSHTPMRALAEYYHTRPRRRRRGLPVP